MTIEDIVAAIGQQSCGAELLVVGNFNSDLEAPEGNTRDEEITADIATAGVEDKSAHLLPHQNTWLRDVEHDLGGGGRCVPRLTKSW